MLTRGNLFLCWNNTHETHEPEAASSRSGRIPAADSGHSGAVARIWWWVGSCPAAPLSLLVWTGTTQEANLSECLMHCIKKKSLQNSDASNACSTCTVTQYVLNVKRKPQEILSGEFTKCFSGQRSYFMFNQRDQEASQSQLNCGSCFLTLYHLTKISHIFDDRDVH